MIKGLVLVGKLFLIYILTSALEGMLVVPEWFPSCVNHMFCMTPGQS